LYSSDVYEAMHEGKYIPECILRAIHGKFCGLYADNFMTP
jgi:hypothetical protein